jgi:hypothetical protein
MPLYELFQLASLSSRKLSGIVYSMLQILVGTGPNPSSGGD